MDEAAESSEDAESGDGTPRGPKRERFIRVAERRTNAVIYRIRVLSNCSNRYTYEYEDEDVRKIFGVLERELALARAKFETSGRPKFSLDGGAPDG